MSLALERDFQDTTDYNFVTSFGKLSHNTDVRMELYRSSINEITLIIEIKRKIKLFLI